MPIVCPEDFGTVGAGTDVMLINQAMQAAGNGGVVRLVGRYEITTSITIPENVRLEGTFSPYGVQPWQSPTQEHTLNSTLIIDPLATIFLSAGSQLDKLSLIRAGTAVAEPNTNKFAGTAIMGLATRADEMDGISLTHLQILGFKLGIYLQMCPRAVIDYISGDNISGIKFGTAYDVVRVKNTHFWPFHTAGAAMTGASHNRSGCAIELAERNDIGQFDGCFSYGYKKGIRVCAEVGTATFLNCHTDNTGQHTDSAGIEIDGVASHTSFIGCSSYSNDTGYKVTAASYDNIHFSGCRSVGNRVNGWVVNNGTAHLTACEVDGSAHGVVVGPNGNAHITSTSFANNTKHNILAMGGLVTENNNKFDNTAPSGGFGLPVVYTSDPLYLPPTGNKFIVAGNGGFGNLFNVWAGREVTLVMDGNITVWDGGSMHLAGNFVATPGSTLKLVHTGSYWAEVSRSIN